VLLLFGLAATMMLHSRRVARERDLARIEQQRANQVVALLVNLFATANPEQTPGGSDMTIGEFLTKVESAVVANRDTDPAVEAHLRRTLGNVYQARSQYAQARRHLEAALEQARRLHGEMHIETAATLHDLARLTITTGPPEAALKLIRRLLDVHRALYGEKHESVAQNMEDLSGVLEAAAEKRESLEKALAIRRSLSSAPTQGIASNLNAQGFLAYETGDAARARSYFEESLAMAERVLPASHPFRFTVLGNLAVCHQRFGQFDQAERLYRALIEERRRIIGEESPPGEACGGRRGISQGAGDPGEIAGAGPLRGGQREAQPGRDPRAARRSAGRAADAPRGGGSLSKDVRRDSGLLVHGRAGGRGQGVQRMRGRG
jgi:tetratricopeptide (TPR) repeat protein